MINLFTFSSKVRKRYFNCIHSVIGTKYMFGCLSRDVWGVGELLKVCLFNAID